MQCGTLNFKSEDKHDVRKTYGWLLGIHLLTDEQQLWMENYEHERMAVKKVVRENNKLDERQSQHIHNFLRNATTKRKYISSVMTWSLDRPQCAEEIATTIIDSLLQLDTPWNTKLARLYIVSDILANTASAVIGGSQKYRTAFETALPPLFHHFNAYCKLHKANKFFLAVVKVVTALDSRAIFPSLYLQGLICCLTYQHGPTMSDLLLHPSLSHSPKEVVTEGVASMEGGILLDAELIAYMRSVPVWLRRNVLEYLTKDILTLCRLIYHRGICVGMKGRIRSRRHLAVTPPKLITEMDPKTKTEDVVGIERPPSISDGRAFPLLVQLEIDIRGYAIEALILWEAFWYHELMKQTRIIDSIVMKHPDVSPSAMVRHPLLQMAYKEKDDDYDCSDPKYSYHVVSPSNWNGKVSLSLWVPPRECTINNELELTTSEGATLSGDGVVSDGSDDDSLGFLEVMET
eukprot:GHVH01001891.1.p1 GENE.GHVH01001891.1~~GHVH01001891.1.p1  ORF type:complete len:461 (-),score=65.84 GHVH01001891.1:535-1917(-)